MADTFTDAQAKRLFGIIAAGGTAGALTGPLLTAALVVHLGPANLLPISAALLVWTLLCIRRLIAWRHSATGAGTGDKDQTGKSFSAVGTDGKMSGSLFAGIGLVMRSSYLGGICVLILLYSTLATFLYFQQAQIVRDSFDDPAARTAVFAAMDFGVNALTLILQLFLTGRIIGRFGVGIALVIIPVLLMGGFVLLGALPVLGVIVGVQVLRRAGNYAIMRPAREMLYVVVSKEEKYKAKNFIDTVIYRGGDAASGWVYTGLNTLMGLTGAQIALAAVPLAGLWAWVAFRLGKRQEQIAKDATAVARNAILPERNSA